MYENNYPAYHNFDEGRIVYKPDGKYFAETYIKDHLGNIRVSYGNDGVKDGIRQVNAYYPFGMNMKELSANSSYTVHRNEYQYNGKMFQDELGLDWYDYGARMYDAVLGRWHVIDNKAEKYNSTSTYTYALNNPVIFIDPDGNEIKIYYIEKNSKGSNQYKSFTFNGSNYKAAPNNSFVQNVLSAYEYNISNGGGDNLKEAATNSSLDIRIMPSDESSDYSYPTYKSSKGEYLKGTITWNPDIGLKTTDGITLSPVTILEHETDHAVDDANNSPEHFDRKKPDGSPYDNKEEERVIKGSESKTATKNGEAPKGWFRKNHEGEHVNKTDWEYKNQPLN